MHQKRRIAANPAAPAALTTRAAALAFITALAVIVAAAVGGQDILKTQDTGGGSISATSATSSLSDGETVVIDDPAIATQGEGEAHRAVKQFERDEQFSQFALTWQGEKDIAAYVRAQQPDGSWGQWFSAEPMDIPGAGGKHGTELIYVEPTKAVQVSITGVDIVSDSAEASGMEAVFIDGGTDSGINLMAESAAKGMPNVVTRAGWGANENQRCLAPTYNNSVKAMTLHHTAGSNNYTKEQAAAQVRGIYQYHGQTLGWCDIGYNVLVDKYGTIYEGRYGGLDKAVEGAHAGGFNTNTWGISMIGNYEAAQPSSVMLDSVAKIAGWKAARSGFDPTGTTTLTSGGFSSAKYGAGQVATLKRFFGHNDVGYTSCPGQYAIAQWPTIRSKTKQYYDKIKSGGQVAAPKPGTKPGTQPAPGTKPGTQPAPDAGNVGAGLAKMSSLAGTSQLSAEDIGAVLSLAGAVVGLLVATGAANQYFAGAGDREVAGGITVKDAVGIADSLLQISGDPDLQRDWSAIKNTVGPVLGQAQGGPTVINEDLAYQLFSNGLVVDSSSTGLHALVGPIAKAWAESGLNAGDLGLPTSDMYTVDNAAAAAQTAQGAAQAAQGAKGAAKKKIRVDFQGGYIDFDPNTQKVNVYTD